MIRVLLGVSLLLGSSLPVFAASESPTILHFDGMAEIARVDPRFQSYNVEMAEIVGGRFWAPYPEPSGAAVPENTEASGGLALSANLFRQRPPADLANRRLRNLAKGLGPAYIRVSGSWANAIFFQDDDKPRLAKPPSGFQNVLTRAQWSGVVAFAKAVGGEITTSFAVSAGARDASGAWSPAEARKLLRYTRQIGGRIHSAELINEPNLGAVSGLPARYDAASFARDIAIFRDFVRRDEPSLKLVGPGSSGEEQGEGPFPGNIATAAMLAAQPKPKFDLFSYHFYGARSQRCQRMSPGTGIDPSEAMSEEWLGRTDKALRFYKALRDREMPAAPIWLNETAQASCGGDKWAASFLDTFRYVDQMGRLAKQGVSVIMHNTLAASDYGLIDERTLIPRPNYWAALLWRRVMGEVVLDAGAIRPGLHVYAHCLPGGRGGVGIAAINLDRSRTATLVLTAPGKRYTLSADHLQGETVNLNGRPLTLAGDSLPDVHGVKAPAGELALAPATVTFISVPTASNRVCR